VPKKSKQEKKARPPERDYSHRTLLDKLGIKPGQRVSVLGVTDSEFLKELRGRVPDFSSDAVLPGADLILLGAESTAGLGQLKSLARAILKNGAIWAVYPKGQKHIREVDVIAAGKVAGLTDNKVARFSETHTALRFVIPLAKR
jgi:hypothetical protein